MGMEGTLLHREAETRDFFPHGLMKGKDLPCLIPNTDPDHTGVIQVRKSANRFQTNRERPEIYRDLSYRVIDLLKVVRRGRAEKMKGQMRLPGANPLNVGYAA